MSEIRFEWDHAKAEENFRKHGVSFEEAQTVFYDDFAIEFYDDTHSQWEDRFLLLGYTSQLRLMMVCHCYRESDSVIRIILARKPTANEASYYRRN
jgi:uncharacterized DUF497 family protein